MHFPPTPKGGDWIFFSISTLGNSFLRLFSLNKNYMENQARYGNSKRFEKEIQFEKGKSIIYKYDCSEMEEEAFAQALEKAKKSNPKTMKNFLYALHNNWCVSETTV
jgi:hypothetical protein